MGALECGFAATVPLKPSDRVPRPPPASATAAAVLARVALLWPFKHLSEENIVAFQ
jgi:hypothetical protein